MTSDKAHFTKLPEPIFGGDSIRDRLNDEYLDGCASPSPPSHYFLFLPTSPFAFPSHPTSLLPFSTPVGENELNWPTWFSLLPRM